MSTVLPSLARQVNPSNPNVDVRSENDTDETIPDFEVDDEFNLPISVAVILLLLYMMCGAAVFTIWEKWTFFESFYFVYISLSTIGFGDYVPEHPAFMMCTFIYLLFGLALTSMCINVVQEKLSSTFQKAKLRIGATMGLDITQLMEEELNQDQSMPSASNPEDSKPFLSEQGIGDIIKERRERKRKNVEQANSDELQPKKDNDSVEKKSINKKNVEFSDIWQQFMFGIIECFYSNRASHVNLPILDISCRHCNLSKQNPFSFLSANVCNKGLMTLYIKQRFLMVCLCIIISLMSSGSISN